MHKVSHVLVEVEAAGEIPGRRDAEAHVRDVTRGGQQRTQRARTLAHAARRAERLVEHLPSKQCFMNILRLSASKDLRVMFKRIEP